MPLFRDNITIEEIRQNFEPGFTYILFEKMLDSGDDADFREVLRMISQRNIVIRETTVHTDTENRRRILAVKSDLCRTDMIFQELFGLIPKHIAYSAYGG